MKKFIVIIIYICIGCIVYSCKTNTDFSKYIAPKLLLQKAQEALDKSNDKLAMKYYKAIIHQNLKAYKDLLLDEYIVIPFILEAKYEIAHLNYKKNKFELAEDEFQDLLNDIAEIKETAKEKYSDQDIQVIVPLWCETLVSKSLERIKMEKEKTNNSKKAKEERKK